MWYLLILLPLFALTVFVAMRSKPPYNPYIEYLDKMGLVNDAMQHEANYPAYGLKIQSNTAIQKPLSFHSWKVNFVGNFVCEISAKGFSSAAYKIELNLSKCNVKANEQDVYDFLLEKGFITENDNLLC